MPLPLKRRPSAARKYHEWLLYLPLLSAVVGASACGDGSNPATPPPSNPVPHITSISPGDVLAGVDGFTLTVNGSGFISSSVVRWNGAERPTDFLGSTQLSATIPANDVDRYGTIDVTVLNPPPGGGTSNPASFTIRSDVERITVSRAYPSLFANDTTQLNAVVIGISGDTLYGREVVWSSGDPDIATVSQEGVVSGITPGLATISATSGGVVSSVEVAVIAPNIGVNRQLAYLRGVEGPQGHSIEELRLIEPDGSASTTISPPGVSVLYYSWSPDGNRIVVAYDNSDAGTGFETHIIRPDGTAEQDLDEFLWTPNWSPDGSRIVYRNYISSGESDVYVLTPATMDRQQLTSAPGDELAPIWSPDGRQIAYLRNVAKLGLAVGELWLMAADGSDQRKMSLPTRVKRVSWSPDGKYIAFSNGYGIWVVGADGSNPHPITPGCSSDGKCQTDELLDAPAWSWDGSRIAYSIAREFGNHAFVAIGGMDGSGTVEVDAGINLSGSNPQWSPDGAQIAYQSRKVKASFWPAISIMDAEGGASRYVTGSENASGAHWRP